MIKKITCILAVFVLMLCMADSVRAETVYITSAKGSDFTTDSALAAKLDKIFSGDLGLYSDSTLKNSVSVPLGSSDAKVGNTYYIKENSGGGVYSGSSCYIYANAVYNTLFDDVPYHGYSSTWKNSSCIATAKSSVSYDEFTSWGVTLGALLRTTGNSDGSYSGSYGHSVIILSYDKNNITYLEGNGDGNGLVRITKRSWSDFNTSLLTNRGYMVSFIVNPTSGKTENTVTTTTSNMGYIGYFRLKNNFTGFSDVSNTSWYYGSVKLSYNLGIFNGQNDNKFYPDNNLTVGEAVTIAARLCSGYWDDRYSFTGGTYWYSSYYEYLSKWGVTLPSKSPSDAVTREEFARLIYSLLPKTELNAIKSEALSDVSTGSPLRALINAGIMTSTSGKARPNATLTRAEAAAIAVRVAKTTERM